jgi:hypothetical protein
MDRALTLMVELVGGIGEDMQLVLQGIGQERVVEEVARISLATKVQWQ